MDSDVDHEQTRRCESQSVNICNAESMVGRPGREKSEEDSLNRSSVRLAGSPSASEPDAKPTPKSIRMVSSGAWTDQFGVSIATLVGLFSFGRVLSTPPLRRAGASWLSRKRPVRPRRAAAGVVAGADVFDPPA